MQIAPHCYAITGLAYSSPWYVNAGFIAGDDMTLVVDAGGNRAAGATIHGYAMAVRPTNQFRVVNTEKHFDHIGGNGFFRGLGIDVWGQAGIARTESEFAAEIEEFNEAIPNPVRRAQREAKVFFEGTELANPNRQITRDTVWDLGGMSAEILLTPGHTPTNISIWVPGDRVLYAGDCLVNSYIPNLEAGGPADWKEWLTSLNRVEQLKPHKVVCGHGPVAEGEDVAHILAQIRIVLHQALEEGTAPTLR